jgi:predicted DNA-binding transcriptional regulator YafY
VERRRIAPLRERIFIGEPASPAVRRSYGEPAALPMRQLQLAFVEERVVRAEYAKESGEPSDRRLEPHALVINWPAWYLMAYDHLRGQSRTFRLDRFLAVTIETETFRARPRQFLQELLSSSGVALARV